MEAPDLWMLMINNVDIYSSMQWCYAASDCERLILHDTWGGSSNAGNLLPFILLNFQQLLRSEAEMLTVTGLPEFYFTYHAQNLKLNAMITHMLLCKPGHNQKCQHISVNLMPCPLPASSQLNVQQGQWHCLCSVLWRLTSKSLKEPNSTLWL